jgi:hypothetical protein
MKGERAMKRWLMLLTGVSLALAVTIPTISAAFTEDGGPGVSAAPPSNPSVDIMYWTSVDPETGQPGGGCATVLTWQDNSQDERGFRIERRRADSATWQPIREVAPDTTEYKDPDVCGGSCYRVGAVGAGGLSGYSDEACYRPDGLAIASTSVSPATEGCWPSPCVTATSVAITGTVMDVSLSARAITLAEGVDGFEVVALTKQTKLVSPDGGEATLQDVRPGMRIQASGEAGESGALLADVVLILPEGAPAPAGPPLERP